MKGKYFLYAVISLFSLVIMTSCATTSLKSVWMNSTYSGGPLKKVLIVGVDRNPAVREILEDEFAEQLEARGVSVIVSRSIPGEGQIPNRGEILSRSKQHGVDSVLIANVLTAEAAGMYESHAPYSSAGDFSVDYPACCQYISTGRDVFIETEIFDPMGDKLIWRALSETIVEGPSLEFSVESFVRAVTKELREKKLLK